MYPPFCTKHVAARVCICLTAALITSLRSRSKLISVIILLLKSWKLPEGKVESLFFNTTNGKKVMCLSWDNEKSNQHHYLVKQSYSENILPVHR